MGALAECFFYLQENDEAQKYAQLFAGEKYKNLMKKM